jgi:hypothetical protein
MPDRWGRRDRDDYDPGWRGRDERDRRVTRVASRSVPARRSGSTHTAPSCGAQFDRAERLKYTTTEVPEGNDVQNFRGRL